MVLNNSSIDDQNNNKIWAEIAQPGLADFPLDLPNKGFDVKFTAWLPLLPPTSKKSSPYYTKRA